jgi:hypothetical protein
MDSGKALDILELAAGVLEQDRPDQTTMNVVRWLRHRAAAMREEGNPSFTCPDCGMTSHNPNDAAASYCGSCHAFKTFPE